MIATAAYLRTQKRDLVGDDRESDWHAADVENSQLISQGIEFHKER